MNRQIEPVAAAVEAGAGTEAADLLDESTLLRVLAEETEVIFLRGAAATARKLGTALKADNWATLLARAYAASQAARRIVSISATSARLARSLIAGGIRKGLGPYEVARALRKAWAGLSRRRSRTIARTETLSARNAGSYAAAKRAGEAAGVAIVKTWIATSDSRTRDPHRAANGQKRKLESPFNVGGVEMQHPGDPEGGAANVVNCRCTMSYSVA